jgi:hypothetical protein
MAVLSFLIGQTPATRTNLCFFLVWMETHGPPRLRDPETFKPANLLFIASHAEADKGGVIEAFDPMFMSFRPHEIYSACQIGDGAVNASS